MTILEVCIDSAEGLCVARTNGADRVELCSVLELGGLTPSIGLVTLAARAGISARAMIRPRAGDFVFDSNELAQMLAEIDAIRETGIEGVVLGASHADGRLDIETLTQLSERSKGLKKTLHRAFDLVPDLDEAIEQAITLGFDTILTSGRAHTALEGIQDLARAHQVAAGRIAIMPGAGISAANVRSLLKNAPFAAIHGSCSAPAKADNELAAKLGFTSLNRRTTSAKSVADLKTALRL
ncbi:copper homeostasis protein CutC [Devosia sp. Leaf64]|uniref:copper homeostasis protein CutC n=1 Tax=Devosia sp. Leaf64 TaxID=1736229 RepID=UPI0007146EFE|nr:copper homeostasis protein CutC [Devosia sp. Leaf64]KQN74976.1 copper homeostasis protein CutC [Devosia sp. Leaf64]